jgi:N-acyl-D-aspartate/D-glutamate deacylase
VSDLLVKGGHVVDGTGAPARRADVRVRDGVIVEVEARLDGAGERVIDATDAYVTPGLIDCHTHFDGEMFWDPSLDPLPLYGMTTAVMGNCGLGIAPITPATRDAVADLMCFVEDLPFRLFVDHVPWGWESWSEYHTVAATVPLTASLFAYTAHNALRANAMGADAWDRPATETERTVMARLLDDALRHGSLGLSTNFFDTDRARRLVPSRVADDAEFEALFDVLARHPRASLQLIARETADARRMCELAGPRRIRILRLTGSFDEHGPDLLERIEREGWDVWRMGGGNVPSTPRLGFDTSIGTAAVTAWHQMVNGPADRKPALLRDPDWRARARHDWDHPLREQNSFKDLASFILSESETGAGPIGISLDEYARERGLHPSDALADWVIANGLGSRYTRLRMGPDEAGREAMVRRNLADPHAIMGGTDAGAHLRMFCGAGANTYLLTHWVKEKRVAPIEQAVHGLTGRIASFFALADRGVVAPGKRGDLTVFSLDEIAVHDEVKVNDLPDGQWRYSRPSGGYRATIVAGTPTVLDGVATGAAPARIGDAAVAARA